MRLLRAYRATGADLPFGSPERAHDVAMEGYFWRFTCPRTGRVLVALIGVNTGPRGPWATLGVATHDGTGDALVVTAHPEAEAVTEGLGASAGEVFVGDDRRLIVRLPDAHLDLTLSDHDGASALDAFTEDVI